MTATVTSKGQVTLPKSIRDKLGIKTGDKLELRLSESGQTAVIIPLNRKANDVFGILEDSGRKHALTPEKMDAGIARAVGAKKQ